MCAMCVHRARVWMKFKVIGVGYKQLRITNVRYAFRSIGCRFSLRVFCLSLLLFCRAPHAVHVNICDKWEELIAAIYSRWMCNSALSKQFSQHQTRETSRNPTDKRDKTKPVSKYYTLPTFARRCVVLASAEMKSVAWMLRLHMARIHLARTACACMFIILIYDP